MTSYMKIISLISMYSSPGFDDESKDHIFAISRLLAVELADLAANYSNS